MSTLDVFCWAVTIASIITVAIWGVVLGMVIVGSARAIWRMASR